MFIYCIYRLYIYIYSQRILPPPGFELGTTEWQARAQTTTPRLGKREITFACIYTPRKDFPTLHRSEVFYISPPPPSTQVRGPNLIRKYPEKHGATK